MCRSPYSKTKLEVLVSYKKWLEESIVLIQTSWDSFVVFSFTTRPRLVHSMINDWIRAQKKSIKDVGQIFKMSTLPRQKFTEVANIFVSWFKSLLWDFAKSSTVVTENKFGWMENETELSLNNQSIHGNSFAIKTAKSTVSCLNFGTSTLSVDETTLKITE